MRIRSIFKWVVIALPFLVLGIGSVYNNSRYTQTRRLFEGQYIADQGRVRIMAYNITHGTSIDDVFDMPLQGFTLEIYGDTPRGVSIHSAIYIPEIESFYLGVSMPSISYQFYLVISEEYFPITTITRGEAFFDRTFHILFARGVLHLDLDNVMLIALLDGEYYYFDLRLVLYASGG